MKTTPMQVTLIDRMGTDLTVVNSARVSFAKSNTEFDSIKDSKLIKYLATHNHWTVFGHCFASFRIKAPIFVARQLVKHTVGLVWNEESRRYIDSKPEFYIPEVWRNRPEGSIKQGSTGVYKDQEYPSDLLLEVTREALDSYKKLLELGIAPEQARMILPLNTHTEWVWSGSLAAWARVCKLRLDSHAQEETAKIARYINNYMEELFPISWEALLDY